MDNLIALSSWSGGKDSCLAYYKAVTKGLKVKSLLNFISEEFKRCCFHGIEAKLINLQSELIGLPLFQKEVSANMQKYEDQFKAAVNESKKDGINAMVFGDIYLEEHENWVKRVCNDLEIKPLEPLWNKPAEEIFREFIAAGFKAIVVSAKADLFDQNFIGRILDLDLLNELKKKKICPCGENGEFHTFVIDGPIFKRGIQIKECSPVLKEGFWKYWFLDIKKYF